MRRKRFSASAYEARLKEYDGCCAACKMKITPATGLEWDHIIDLQFGGEDVIENLQPMCRGCHKSKTGKGATARAKADRRRQRNLGIRKSKRPLPGSKGSGFRKKFDGTIVRVKE